MYGLFKILFIFKNVECRLCFQVLRLHQRTPVTKIVEQSLPDHMAANTNGRQEDKNHSYDKKS